MQSREVFFLLIFILTLQNLQMYFLLFTVSSRMRHLLAVCPMSLKNRLTTNSGPMRGAYNLLWISNTKKIRMLALRG